MLLKTILQKQSVKRLKIMKKGIGIGIGVIIIIVIVGFSLSSEQNNENSEKIPNVEESVIEEPNVEESVIEEPKSEGKEFSVEFTEKIGIKNS